MPEGYPNVKISASPSVSMTKVGDFDAISRVSISWLISYDECVYE